MTQKSDPSTTALWARFRFSVVGSLLEESLILSWDTDAPFAVDLSGRFPAFAIEAKAQKGRRDERLPMTPDFARWLLENTPAADRHGPVFPLLSLLDGQPIGKLTAPPYQMRLDTSTLTPHVWHSLTAEAYNAAGQRSRPCRSTTVTR